MDTPSKIKLDHRYAMFALVLASVVIAVTVVAVLSRERIAANERAWFVARLSALVPAALHDNDLYADRILVNAPDLLGIAPTTIYRARNQGQPVALIMTVVARDGYGGAIELLLAVDYPGRVLGVDIFRHNETQGIGDGFAPHRSHWLHDLAGHALFDPPPRQWTIRKDGGEFEQFTGASITPRAILKATRLALEYYAANRESLFNAPVHQSN